MTAQSHALGDVKLELPAIPGTFFCVGVNYRDHVDRMAAKRGVEPPSRRGPTSAIAPTTR